MPATNYNTAISMCHLPPCQPHTTTYFSMCHLLQCVTYPTTTYFSVSVTPQLLTSVCVTYHHAITHYNTTISMCHIPPCQPHTRHHYQHVSFTTMPATHYTTTYFSCPISLACLSFSVSSSLGTTVCCLHMQKREHVKQGL